MGRPATADGGGAPEAVQGEAEIRAAIIGHGTSVIGKGWGPKIDTCTTVRMHDSAWQQPADWGERRDIGFLVLNERFAGEAIGKWSGACRKIACVLHGRNMKLTRDVPKDVEIVVATDLPDMYAAWCPKAERPIAMQRGTAAAATAMRLLKPKEMILVGFDNMRNGVVSERAAGPEYPEVLGRDHWVRIDLASEARFIEEMARRHGVVMQHAEDVWQG